jgi:hypothetical protein
MADRVDTTIFSLQKKAVPILSLKIADQAFVK